MLLARVATNLYWAARYLERAEDTARIIREHTNVLVDLPTSVMSSWEPLLAITGAREAFDARYDRRDEGAVIRFLISDPDNPASIVSSVESARENMRACREVIPKETWLTVNDLHLFASANADDGVLRRSRTRFLDRIITEHQQAIGITIGTMQRDDAYTFMRLGRHVERADMTTRVLDVRAGDLMAREGGRGDHADILWTSVLRSLSALQAYHRVRNGEVDGRGTIEFVLHERSFPRSVEYCLASAGESIARLPHNAAPVAACAEALAFLASIEAAGLDAPAISETADRLQIAIGTIHDNIVSTWFASS